MRHAELIGAILPTEKQSSKPMKTTHAYIKIGLPSLAAVMFTAASAAAAGMPRLSQFYAQHNIVSDVPGLADDTAADVVNERGLDAGDASTCWLPEN